MNTDQKIIKNKVGLLNLSEKLRGMALGVITACLLTYSLDRHVWSPRFWLLFAFIALILGMMIRFVMSLWFKSLDANRRELEHSIAVLTNSEARRRAFELLSDPSHYRTVARTTPGASVDLPPTLSEVFDQFEVVTDTTGNRLSLGARISEFIDIGMLHHGVRLLARLSDGGIFEVWPDQSGIQIDPDFPSIYHWLVINAGGSSAVSSSPQERPRLVRSQLFQ